MKGEYSTAESDEARVAVVDIGDGRQFLVARFKIRDWKTLVFELDASKDRWIFRREVSGDLGPVNAVTGHLLAHQSLDPITQLKRDLDRERRCNWELRNELTKLKADARAGAGGARKRGGEKRGRRNT